jgi:hypothetical protein
MPEAKKIAEIYMNSYCTIAAHSADHGFLDKSLANPRLGHLDGSSKNLMNSSNRKFSLGRIALQSQIPKLSNTLLYHQRHVPRDQLISGYRKAATSDFMWRTASSAGEPGVYRSDCCPEGPYTFQTTEPST